MPVELKPNIRKYELKNLTYELLSNFIGHIAQHGVGAPWRMNGMRLTRSSR